MSSEESNFSKKVLGDLSVFIFHATKLLFEYTEYKSRNKISWSNLDQSLLYLLEFSKRNRNKKCFEIQEISYHPNRLQHMVSEFRNSSVEG